MIRSSTYDALAWDVEVPGKRQTQAWGYKPRGALIINAGHDDEERIELPKAVACLLASKQKTGEIHPSTAEELVDMTEALSRTCARSRIERLINRREYTADEIGRKLAEDGYTSETTELCVQKACDIGLISNRRFADAFIRSKLSAGWGVDRVVRELAQRGIDVDELVGWPYEYVDPDDEVERATSLAQKRNAMRPHTFPKLVRYLCGRGFRTGVAVQAATRVLGDDATAY